MLFICLIIPALIALGLIIYSAVIGGRAWLAARHVYGEEARVLRLLALSLCEPLFGTPIALATLALMGRMREGPPDAWLVLICWPMLVLLAPVFVAAFRQTSMQKIAERSLQLGIARLVCNTLCFGLLPWVEGSGLLGLLAIVAVFGLPFVSIGVLWFTIEWAKPIISASAPSVSNQGALSPQHTANARPAVSAAIVAAQHAATPCPDCHAPTMAESAICPHCGLVFASNIPEDLRDVPRFTILRALNAGGMSQIYLARDRAVGDQCVIKVATSPEAERCLAHEAMILRDLRHRGIVSLVGWYPDAARPLLALNYVPGPTLDHVLANGPITLDRGLHYARNVAETLCHLASRPIAIVHADLKPGNLMINPATDIVTLIDFGSAIELRAGGSSRRAGADHYGTPGYAAPELYRGNPTPQSDVYGLAATLYHLATGDDPTTHPLAFPAIGMLPPPLARVLSHALAMDPAARPSPFMIRDTLRSLAIQPIYSAQSSTVSAQRS